MRSVALILVAVAGADPERRYVHPGPDGRLAYPADARGNRVPDFSHAGYGGGAAIPDVPVRAVVAPGKGDAGPRIQAAIDHVAGLAPGADGFRGAVLLLTGRHEVAGHLRIGTSGVVLRGQGKETVLVATGTDRRAVVRVRGRADRTEEKPRPVADAYVPVGVDTLRLGSADGLKAGDAVVVEHPSTEKWIAAIGMDRFPSRDKGSYLDWKPGTLDIRWDRVVTKVDGDRVTLDAPLTTALDAAHGTATVRRYAWPGRVRNVGVENLRLESAFDPKNPHDEDHAWTGVTVENAEDVWVRRVSFRHLAGSAVAVWETARRVTVEDCDSADPVSEVGGQRRHTFLTAGGQTLFLRCTATGGRHDFAVGHLAPGPTAFVRCKATDAHGFSGPVGSWASGVLYDNVHVDGGGLALTNRETDDHGVGWAAANSVLWQCSAPVVTCRTPPTAQNWAVGVWGQLVGDGHWRQFNEFVKPDSLYEAQLADRLGAKAAAVLKAGPVTTDPGDAKRIGNPAPAPAPPAAKPLALTDGRLTVDGKLVAGDRVGTAWWQGHTLPSRATERGIGVTRFVPGRVGPGFTDDLDELTDQMRADGVAALDHHWGLWYDRRRDDHQMIRRIDGGVWAPFYELPWARSGKGRAWDGLSRYDLTRFNPWYFARLKEFADHCGRKGLVLVQQMYFQHNVLEAGAHWADFPWRPANCLQETGFPEPPEYAGGKRVFMAAAFYDVTHPVRRDLHRRYIRHCLDVLGGCPNVVFQTGEEFTGPRHFVEFWLDTVAEWQKESGKTVLVGLSCTKDVQDAILADPLRSALVSVIDLKYWWYTARGGVYDPTGGEDLAPRQQLREWAGDKARSAESVARAVREYRSKFPGKAVTVSHDGGHGWAALAAGASLPDLPKTTAPDLLAAGLKPFESKLFAKGQYALAEPGERYLVYSAGGPVRLDLAAARGPFAAAWVDPKTGALAPLTDPPPGGAAATVRPAGAGPAVLWVRREPK
ncbi:MAG: pectate lyase [Isosphaera sp.]|nr:pectate lyase [Isosphaera sp.]